MRKPFRAPSLFDGFLQGQKGCAPGQTTCVTAGRVCLTGQRGCEPGETTYVRGETMCVLGLIALFSDDD